MLIKNWLIRALFNLYTCKNINSFSIMGGWKNEGRGEDSGERQVEKRKGERRQGDICLDGNKKTETYLSIESKVLANVELLESYTRKWEDGRAVASFEHSD